MWNLDDETRYMKVHAFTIPKAFTYADTRVGHTDRDKREYIRAEAARNFPSSIDGIESWAFRIFVNKSGYRPFDIENVPKLFIDAFCKRQIQQDQSEYGRLGLFDDDTIDFVKIIEVGGRRTQYENTTNVEIFGYRQELKD